MTPTPLSSVANKSGREKCRQYVWSGCRQYVRRRKQQDLSPICHHPVSASYASSVLPAPSYLSWQFAWSFRLGHTERGGGREEKTRAAAAASVAKFPSEKLICSICVRRMAAEEEEEKPLVRLD